MSTPPAWACHKYQPCHRPRAGEFPSPASAIHPELFGLRRFSGWLSLEPQTIRPEPAW